MLRLWLSGLSEKTDVSTLPLSAYRIERLRGVRNAALRSQMLAAERLLIAGLREFGVKAPLDIGVSERGKPFLRGSSLCFNLSHTDSFAACAISDREIGLDIQARQTGKESLIRRFFTAQEQEQLQNAADADSAFTALWCCKESYLKALGTGLSTPLNSFSVLLDEPPRLDGDGRVRFWLSQEPRYALSLCTLDGSDAKPDAVTWL